MSRKKQVIHVRDLVIKADNVIIEPPRRKRDPFFGGPLNRQTEGIQEDLEKHEKQKGSDEKDDDRPSIWI